MVLLSCLLVVRGYLNVEGLYHIPYLYTHTKGSILNLVTGIRKHNYTIVKTKQTVNKVLVYIHEQVVNSNKVVIITIKSSYIQVL